MCVCVCVLEGRWQEAGRGVRRPLNPSRRCWQLQQSSSSGGDTKESDSGKILKVKLAGFSDGLFVR